MSRAVINEEVGEKGLKSYYLLGERRRGVRRGKEKEKERSEEKEREKGRKKEKEKGNS